MLKSSDMADEESTGISAILGSGGRIRLCGAAAERLSGKERLLSLLWEREGGEASESFIRAASSSGLLSDEESIPLKTDDVPRPLLIRISEHNGEYVFTIQLEGIDGIPEDVRPGIARIGSTLFFYASGSSISALRGMIPATVKKDDVPLLLSRILSRNGETDVMMDGYAARRKPPVKGRSTLLLRKIDRYGYLHLTAGISASWADAEYISQNRLTVLARLNEDTKSLEIEEIIYPAEDAAAVLMEILGKKAQGNVYRDGCRFVLSRDAAAALIGRNLKTLLSFRLDGTGLLSEYGIICGRPEIKLRLFSSGEGYLEGDGTAGIGGEEIPLQDMLKDYDEESGFLRIGGKDAYIDPELIRELKRFLSFTRGMIRVSTFDLPLIDESSDITAEGPAADNMRRFFKGLREARNLPYEPMIRAAELRSYQKEGCRWLRYLHDSSMGGYLADEMGLGKTVQIIALLNGISVLKPGKPSLIIVPRSLISNWVSEIARFGIALESFVYYGQSRDPENLRKLKGGIVITSYATVRNDAPMLSSISFDCIILDESQAVKNIYTQTAQAVGSLKADHRIAISGTPIENGTDELYSLFNFLNPGSFATLASFERTYSRPIASGDRNAENELRKRIAPFMLRRLKKDVLSELPDRTDETAFIDMAEEHMTYYERRRLELRKAVLEATAEKGRGGAGMIVLKALMELRRIASMPEAMMDTGTVSSKRSYLRSAAAELVSSGHKILIFTNFLDTVERLSADLSEMGIGYVSMTGSAKDRAGIVERFQNDPATKVFIMTLKTGGVGLNLTAADYAFITDPWWNAAAEDQAMSRMHRMGQKNPVFCFRLIAKGTIEEKILKLQKIKKELSASLLSTESSLLSSLTDEDIEELFS